MHTVLVTPDVRARALSPRECRERTLEAMLAALTAKKYAERRTINWLTGRCERCGACKRMPPKF